jgi:hypothetical protein
MKLEQAILPNPCLEEEDLQNLLQSHTTFKYIHEYGMHII